MNKKKQYNIIFSRIILAVLLITMILPIRALASDRLWDSDTMPSSRQKPRLLDNADLLYDDEETQLLTLLDTTSQKWQCNIAILTVDDHTGEIQDFADNYFDYNGFQADYNGSGILFMLSMADREWAISTCGNAIDTPYDVNSKPIRTASDYMSYALYSVIIGLLLALAPILKMKADLKTVKMNSGARNYSAGGPTIRARDDRFLHKTLHKTPRPKDTDSHSSGRGGSFGGGSSVHVSGSGSSHGGSHGHF